MTAVDDEASSVEEALNQENSEYFRKWRDADRRASDHQRASKQAWTRVKELEKQLDFATNVDAIVADPPSWMVTPPKRRKKHHGIVNLLLSDLHLDEVVDPAQMGGVNAYNREIAMGRLHRTFDQTIEVARDFISGVTYQGITVWMAGDTFSGNIHEELKQTNEEPILASLDYWIDPMVAGFNMLADEYGKVMIACVVGNHGRLTHKPVAKNRVKDNFDWFFARQLWRALNHDKRFTFHIPETPDLTLQQYNTRFLLTHGDQFRGGSGISGIMTPLALGDYKKTKRQMAVNDEYDYMLLGHFHQYMTLPRIIVNGSLKGYDEYAQLSNFGFEVPQQAFWITTPEHGVTFSASIRPMNRAVEGW